MASTGASAGRRPARTSRSARAPRRRRGCRSPRSRRPTCRRARAARRTWRRGPARVRPARAEVGQGGDEPVGRDRRRPPRSGSWPRLTPAVGCRLRRRAAVGGVAPPSAGRLLPELDPDRARASAGCCGRWPARRAGPPRRAVHSTGWRMNGSVCGPPRPPCEPISSSNAATSPSSGSYWLSSSRSGAWTIASSRLRLMIVCGPNSVVGSSPSTRSSSRKRVPFGPKTTAPNSFERTISIPTPGMRRDRRDEARVELLELLDRQPVVVAGEPDEAEVARARRPRSTPASATGGSLLVGVEVDDAVGRLAREGGARDGRPDALALGDLRQERVDEDRPLGLGLGLDRASRARSSGSRTNSPRLTP